MGTEAECNRRHAGADFHTILAVSGSAAPSVVRLRMQGLDALGAAGVVEKVMADFGEKLREGALVTVKGNKVTCHKLPIGEAQG